MVIGLSLWLLTASQRFRVFTPYLLLIFFLVVGGLHGTLSLQAPSSATHIYHLARERRELSLVGVLARSPEIGSERTTMLMELREIRDRQGQATTAEGLVQLSMAAPPPPALAPGDLFIARATVGPVPSFGVPGAFNYQEYLACQGIHASGWIRSPAMVMKINRALSPGWGERLRALPEAVRYRLRQFLAASLPPQSAGVYQAILLGEMANLSPKVQEDFKASGSVHILSISGLHMALLSLSVTLLLSWLLRRSEWVLLHLSATKVAALLSLLPLTAYALIAGFNPPVVRSLIMVGVFVFALLVDRQWSIPTNIAIAAFLLLAANPTLLFTASFQLTFAAVAAIALFASTLATIVEPASTDGQRFRVRVWLGFKRWALASLLISFAASLGTAPILAYQFNRVSLVSPVSTLLIEPFLCLWSLLLGLAACLLVGVPALAKGLLELGAIGINIAVDLADFCARLPWSSVWLPTPTLAAIAGWYGALFLLAFHSKLSRRNLGIGLAACVGLAATIFLPASASSPGPTRLTVLDVGQGSAMIIEMPNHEVILVDGGRKQSPSASGLNVGESLIAPFLWGQRIRRLSAVIATHPDADHYNGIPFILRQFRPETLWVNGYESEEKGYKEMLDLATQLGIGTQVPAAGTVLVQSGGATLTVVAGGSQARASAVGQGAKKVSSGNNQSLVLRLTHGQTSFLLPSDIEAESEASLLADRQYLKAEVLVAPHHGSTTSSSEGFVGRVSPRYVVISAGQNQTGNFPAPEVLARYQRFGSGILNTAERGSIFLYSDGQTLRIETFR